MVDGWRATRAAVAAAGFLRFDVSERGGRDALLGLARLGSWFARTGAASGVGFALKALKGWSSQLRLWAIQGVPRQERRGGLARFFRGPLRSLVDSDERAIQVSYLGRALPKGDQGVADAALRAHRQALSTPWPTPPELLQSAREFAADWGRRYLPKTPDAVFTRLGHGASEGFPRSKGGFAAAMVELSGRDAGGETSARLATLQKLRAELPAVQGVSDCDLDALVAESRFLRREVLPNLPEDGKPARWPRSSVVAVAERGFKARVVTRGPAWLVAGLHHVRPWLLTALKRDPRSAVTLSGDHRRAVEEVVRVARPQDGWEFLSADLTSASDLLPSDLLEALIEGLEEAGTAAPSWFFRILRVGSGPQVLSYPGGEEIFTARGTLMGLPHTWCLLSLVHLFWVDQACRVSRDARVHPSLPRRAAICGDDLVAHWPKWAIERYETVVAQCGGKASAGKQFRSKNRFCFTEDTGRSLVVPKREVRSAATRTVTLPSHPGTGAPRVVVAYGSALPSYSAQRDRPWQGRMARGWPRLGQPVPRRMTDAELRRCRSSAPWVVGIRWGPAVPLRGLVRPNRMPPTNGVRSDPEVPLWVALGPAFWSAVGEPPDPRRVRAARRAVAALHPGIWAWAESVFGSLATVPREFGGLGLPRRRGDATRVGRLPRRIRHGLAVLLYGRTAGRVGPPGGAWQVFRPGHHRQMAMSHLSVRLARVSTRCRRGKVPFRGQPAAATRLGSEADAQERGVLAISRELTYVLGPEAPGRRIRISPGAVAAGCRRAYRRFDTRWRRARGVQPSTSWTTLLRRSRDLAEGWTLWLNPGGPDEGFGGWGLGRSAKRALSGALGWA